MKEKLKLFLIMFFFFSCNNSFAGLYSNIDIGIEEYRKNNLESAKNYFIQYINNTPNDSDGYYWLGKTYLRLKNKQLANENFEQSYNIFSKEKDIDSINFENNKNENINDYIDMAKVYFDGGNLQEANFYADMILKIDSKSANALFIKAKIAQIEGKIDLAKEYLKKAIIFDNGFLKTNLAKKLGITSIPKITPDECYKYIFDSYFSGDTNKALIYSRKYISLDNQNYEIYNFISKLYFQNGSIQDAIDSVNEAKKINDKNTESYILETKYNKENNEDIEKSLLKAYEINPNNQDVLYNLGSYYLKTENYKKAEEYFLSLININDAYYEGYAGYILSLIKNNKTEEALKNIRKASSLNKNQSELNILLAEICISQFKYKEALDYIEEALNKDKNPYYYLKKAEIQNIIKDYKGSISTLDTAAKFSFIRKDNRLYDLYLKNYIKQKDYRNIERYINYGDSVLDKNSLSYKYYLYELYKYRGDVNQEKYYRSKVFGYKPETLNDYIIYSEILFEENQKEAINFLDKAIKRNKDLFNELNYQKNKLIFLSDSN